jgi:hypothetical protein
VSAAAASGIATGHSATPSVSASAIIARPVRPRIAESLG